MDVETIVVDRQVALDHVRKFKEHRAHGRPLTELDIEIARANRAALQGRILIRAQDSIVKAGTNERGLPKLALAPLDASHCHLSIDPDGSATMSAVEYPQRTRRGAISNRRFDFPRGSFSPAPRQWARVKAVMPYVPPDLRPLRGLENYCVLWEAEWSPIPPRDPMLLRRIGKADLWVVLGVWDLTEVERAVLAARIAVRN